MTPLNGISSGKIQRNLATATEKVNSSFTRLSSALRINKASDDAAGLSVASQLNADRRIVTRGVMNLNDGISATRIADAALGELSNITTRILELAQQSANGTLSTTQRQALDKEAQGLSSEYQRIIDTTSFNGKAVLGSELGELRLQAGRGNNGGFQSSFGGVNGTGRFSDSVEATSGDAPKLVITADLNGDGKLDVANSNTNSDSVSVYFGDGAGNFSAPTTLAAGDQTFGLTSEDFNGDGITDIAATNSNAATISVFLGQGGGSFSAGVTYATAGVDPFSIVSKDFNKDGKLDLVTADAATNSVSIFLGQGDGTFNAATSVASGSGATTVISEDFDRDGNLDLATADFGSNTVSILLGNGRGNFTLNNSYATGGLVTRSVTAGDFNGDGALDLAASNRDSDNITVFTGNGNGTFSAAGMYATGTSPRDIVSADLNGDGKDDLAVAALDTDTVEVLLSQGNGTFTNAVAHSAGDGARAVAAGDINNDGVYDLISANELGDNISILAATTTSGTAPLLNFSLTSAESARQALPGLHRRLDQLSTQRGKIGAFESRIEVANSVSQAHISNLRSAESRIMDADIAAEVADLTKSKVQQNVASAMLAQANQNPKALLNLLF